MCTKLYVGESLPIWLEGVMIVKTVIDIFRNPRDNEHGVFAITHASGTFDFWILALARHHTMRRYWIG